MSHDSNGRIYTESGKGIDVRGDVAYVLGESTGDVGMLCVSKNINEYAKNKPVRYNSLVTPSDAQKKAINYGLTAPVASSTPAATKETFWVYTRPDGAPSGWYRILDFDGYNHKAVCPVIAAGDITVKQTETSGTIIARFQNVVGSITLSDLGDLNGYYLAVFMIGTNNLPYLKTAGTPFGTAVSPALSLVYSELTPFASGTEYYLCLCDTKQTTIGPLPAGAKYLPFPIFMGGAIDDFVGIVTKKSGYDVTLTFDMLFNIASPPTAANFTAPAPPKPNYIGALPSPDPYGKIDNRNRYYFHTTSGTGLAVRFTYSGDDTLYADAVYANLSRTYYGTPTVRRKCTVYELDGGTVKAASGALVKGTTYIALLPAQILVWDNSGNAGGAIPGTDTAFRATLNLYDGGAENSVRIGGSEIGISNCFVPDEGL